MLKSSATTAESTHSKEDGKDAGGAGPETGAVPFPQQKVKGGAYYVPLKMGGTTKCCVGNALVPWNR